MIARIGLTSFGGGISGWMLRIVVQERRWMTEGEFLSGLALCQVLPGINVVNLSIWLGYRFHGGIGAIAAAAAIIVPPGIVVLLLLTGLSHVSGLPWVQSALAGVTAAAVGLGASMGFRAARHCVTAGPLLIMAALFGGVGLLHLPLLWVLPPLAVLSIAIEWRAP